MKGYDYNYWNRMELLAELMIRFPLHKVRKLQKSALREYTTEYKGVYRHCMGYHFASKAADLANKMEGITND
jgi:hypothetical protein